jgi:uncharacterized protein
MDKIEIITHLRAQQDALQKAGVKHLAIFGSRARGDHRRDSDLDVLLDIAKDDKFSLLDLIGIEHLISDATGLQASAQIQQGIAGDLARTIADDVTPIF